MRLRKVGGIHFLRIWKLQFSFCLCRAHKGTAMKANTKRQYRGGATLGLGPHFDRLRVLAAEAGYPKDY